MQRLYNVYVREDKSMTSDPSHNDNETIGHQLTKMHRCKRHNTSFIPSEEPCWRCYDDWEVTG